jgi:5-amino-6-(5-phospho-D-ribitylamino)uracil phosphatase
MKYKLLVLDVDGTLVESKKDGKLSPTVIEAIKKINNKIKISLCTGRTWEHAQYIINTLGIQKSYHLIESGAKLMNPNGELEYVKYLKLSEINRIVKTAKNLPSSYGFCVNGIFKSKVNEIGSGQTTIVSLHTLNKIQTQNILKIIEPLRKKYSIHVGSNWFNPEGEMIFVTHKEASKAYGLQYIKSKLGVRSEETIGVGDMPNDLPLFQESGLKVAMGNADKLLKDRADIIAPALKDDGIAWVIENYLICK